MNRRSQVLYRRSNRLMKRIGTAVTFTLTLTTQDPLTGEVTVTGTQTVTGHAMPEDPVTQNRGLTLTQTSALMLLFSPAVRGQQPELGSVVVWGGASYTVRTVAHEGIDDVSVLFHVGCAR